MNCVVRLFYSSLILAWKITSLLFSEVKNSISSSSSLSALSSFIYSFKELFSAALYSYFSFYLPSSTDRFSFSFSSIKLLSIVSFCFTFICSNFVHTELYLSFYSSNFDSSSLHSSTFLSYFSSKFSVFVLINNFSSMSFFSLFISLSFES